MTPAVSAGSIRDLARCDPAHRRDELRATDLLEQISAGAGKDGREESVASANEAQHQAPQVWHRGS